MNSEKYLNDVYEKIGNLKYDFRNKNLLFFLFKELNKHNNILEIGCGNSILLNKLHNARKTVEGLEPSKELVAMALKTNNKLVIHHTELEKFKTNKKYDTIIMIDVLEHIKNDIVALEKCYKLLNKGGNLILFVPINKWLYGKRDKNLGHFRRYNKKELYIKLRSCQFKIKKIRYWNMIGVLPYFIYEQILNKEFKTALRENKDKTIFQKLIYNFFNFWFYTIENNINLGFGFSMFVVAKK